jgi:hypothetical protein
VTVSAAQSSVLILLLKGMLTEILESLSILSPHSYIHLSLYPSLYPFFFFSPYITVPLSYPSLYSSLDPSFYSSLDPNQSLVLSLPKRFKIRINELAQALNIVFKHFFVLSLSLRWKQNSKQNETKKGLKLSEKSKQIRSII